MKLRLHVIALPHTNVSTEHTSCAFNQKVLKFCRMMMGLKHEVFLYSSEQTDAPFTEHIVCISETERVASLKGKHYTEASFNASEKHWRKFNMRAILGLIDRIQPRDFICVIGGRSHKEVADAFPQNQAVEFGIGYPGVFAKFQVFESYAWMHATYGTVQGTDGAQGNFYHAVIPSYFDLNEFPAAEPKDHFLYIGRLADSKGWRIAQQVCEHLKVPLIVAGPGQFNGYGKYVGEVGPEERAKIMSSAKGLFCPTLYVEPFGSVHVEAMLCGTPVITTDWGAFTETFTDGVHGFRCHSMAEFIAAAQNVGNLDRAAIRAHAQARFSLDVVALKYDSYFHHLLTLWGEGFNTRPARALDRPKSKKRLRRIKNLAAS